MSEVYEVEGVLESVSKNQKGFKIDGEWYNSFLAQHDARYKDTVKFKVKEKESGGRVYKNIEGTIEVLSGTEVTDKATGEKKMVGFPIGTMDRERSIVRRHAVSAATELLSSMAKAGVEVQIDVESVIDTARKLEYYTSGDEVKDLIEA
jgi:hypothetical protein|tara:strand:- start:1267 stop:1713 length:447 start_codon:yes stop_codon:yes gene_type:complete